MKKYILPTAALLSFFYWPTSCTGDGSSTSSTDSVSTVTTTTESQAAAPASAGTHVLVETETYTDLRTGKTFRIKKDNSGNYTTESGEQLTYYYSPSTQDTFYGPTGRWVNNALNYDQSSGYSIDEQRAAAQMSDMDKVKITDEEYKAKSENGDKVKITNDETKIKTAEGDKIKANEDELKIKTVGGAKIKVNENETKIKIKK